MGDGSSGQKNNPDLRRRVFLEETSRYGSYSNKKCKKEHHSIKLRTWNMWNLNQGGKLENLKGDAEESSVCLGATEV